MTSVVDLDAESLGICLRRGLWGGQMSVVCAVAASAVNYLERGICVKNDINEIS